MRYRKLGKTGLMVSEIGFGGKCPGTLAEAYYNEGSSLRIIDGY